MYSRFELLKCEWALYIFCVSNYLTKPHIKEYLYINIKGFRYKKEKISQYKTHINILQTHI